MSTIQILSIVFVCLVAHTFACYVLINHWLVELSDEP